MSAFEMLGMAGIAISLFAYLPQMIHLAREHCSAGVSGRAWAMWMTSSLLVGALAVHRRDPVFILLQLSTLTSAAVILVLVHRYRGMVCEAHARFASSGRLKQDAGVTVGVRSQPRSVASLDLVAEEEMVAVRTDAEQPAPRPV